MAPVVGPLFTPEMSDRAHSKDEGDVAEMLPRLEPGQVAWLRATLQATHPDPQWLRLLPSADETQTD